jgi:hypothetical protein
MVRLIQTGDFQRFPDVVTEDETYPPCSELSVKPPDWNGPYVTQNTPLVVFYFGLCSLYGKNAETGGIVRP